MSYKQPLKQQDIALVKRYFGSNLSQIKTLSYPNHQNYLDPNDIQQALLELKDPNAFSLSYNAASSNSQTQKQSTQLKKIKNHKQIMKGLQNLIKKRKQSKQSTLMLADSLIQQLLHQSNINHLPETQQQIASFYECYSSDSQSRVSFRYMYGDVAQNKRKQVEQIVLKIDQFQNDFLKQHFYQAMREKDVLLKEYDEYQRLHPPIPKKQKKGQ